MKNLIAFIMIAIFVNVVLAIVAVKNSWSDIKRYVKDYFKTLRVRREARKMQHVNQYLFNKYISPKP